LLAAAPTFGIPSLLRDLTRGERSTDVKGDTVREVIDRLEERYPGIKDRLIENDRFRR